MKVNSKLLSALLCGGALILAAAALFIPSKGRDSGREARRVETALGRRLQLLDTYVDKAFAIPANEWMDLGRLPEDMVVYRYVGERMQSWSNQFPVTGDDIVRRPYATRRRRGVLQNAFVDLKSNYTYMKLSLQYGYVLKRVDKGIVTVVAGLRIDDNERLRLSEGYAVRTLHTPDGESVSYAGQPVFKLVYESLAGKARRPALLLWAAFLIFCAGVVIFLRGAPRLRYGLISSGVVFLLAACLFKWYPPAAGELGQISIILIINVAVFIAASCLYICRRDLWIHVRSKVLAAVLSVCDLLLVAGIFVLSYLELFKVFVYTHINLDLTKFEILGWNSAAVLVSVALILVSVLPLLQLMRPAVRRVVGRDINLLSVPGRIISSLVLALYLVITTTSMGFEREQMIVSSWAENLANDRDNALEVLLKSVETRIASDETLSRASGSEENARIARDHILDKYLFRILSEYDVRVTIGGDSDALSFSTDTPLDRKSHFYYSPLPGLRSRYVGVFQYYVEEEQAQNTIYIAVEPKLGDTRSISSILGIGESADVIPSRYSYAKYKGVERLYLRGSYAYPTKLSQEKSDSFRELHESDYVQGGYLHFAVQVSDDELIIISRKYNNVDSNLLALALVALLFFIVSEIYASRKHRAGPRKKNSFKRTITALITVSLTIAMAVLVTFSVAFVIRRNEANARTMMADKTNSIRTMLQSRMRMLASSDEIVSRQTLELLLRVSENTGSDISLFRPDGKILLSTSPELFEKMVLGSRLNQTAYYHIVHLNEGYYIQKERYGTRSIYTMYAPVMGTDGSLIAIFASPYMEGSYDFQLDALTHTISIILLFLILLMISIALISYVVDKTFEPISEMSRKMEAGEVDRLEYISYDRQDEISILVQSYNRMVTDLTASTKALAQAERDKAWSEMARNVAHEIKNPLTPMRLQIQRIQRLKSNGDPSWQEKFDDMAVILLDHIDVLTETANQFSDFAKLYSEEPVRIALDDMLREEIEMYDNRPGVDFEYLGLPDVMVSGPRPQLVRVFVNILNNAVQACEGREGARVLVSLRNGADPGYYEIVFEDNGPGVDEENLPKLFTPKFTTKSSGSGLGLSICKSILERCGATIAYSRSFTLGGACFTIKYPRG